MVSCEPRPFAAADGELFWDGSCSDPMWKALARAGSAWVQFNAEAQLSLSVRGTVPSGYEQTVAMSEHLALFWMADSGASRTDPPIAYGDCVAAVNGWRTLSGGSSVPWSMPMGSLFRACASARWLLAQVLKTKAPSEARAAEFGTERQKFEGTYSSIVDARAKSAVVDLQDFPTGDRDAIRAAIAQ